MPNFFEGVWKTTRFLNESDLKIWKNAEITGSAYRCSGAYAYLEDFSKPKIIWKRIGSILRFGYDENGSMGLDSTCFATGKHLKYLCAIFNSNLGRYLMKDAPKTGTGDLLVSVQAIEPLLIPFPSDTCLLDSLLDNQVKEENIEVTNQINQIVYNLYSLSDCERLYINSYITQFQ